MHSMDRYAELMQVGDREELCLAIFRIGDSLGFGGTLLAILSRPDMRMDEAFVRSHCGPEWQSHDDLDRLACVDPVVAHCTLNNRPLIWSPGMFAAEGRKRMHGDHGFGMHSGVTLPIHGARGERGMICFVNEAKPGRAFDRDIAILLPELSLLRDIVSDASSRFFDADRQALPDLTRRELECLKWVAAGKSTWGIACILRCSEAVVNFHMTNVRRKFGVNSRHEAALKAVRLGLIGF